MGSIAVAPTLTDEERADFLALTKGSDTVELKLTVPLSDRSRAGAALGWIPSTARSGRSTFSTRPTWRSTRVASSCAVAVSRARGTTQS